MKSNWGIGWVIAFVGFPLGGLLVMLLVGPLGTVPQGVIGGALAGIVIGAAQWLALRRRLAIGPMWIPASALGLALGVGLSMALFGAETTPTAILMRAPLAGLLLGVGQWWLLRRQLLSAWVWPVITALAYTVAWFITAQVIGENRSLGFVNFGASGAVTYQVLTGLILWRLLRSSVTNARA